jgi:hypothetical protein
MALTKLQCDHAVCPPGKVRVRLADEHGLFLQVTAAGQKYWRMKYRFGGKEKVIAFGVYPEVTLAEARERRDAARQILRDGRDPLELRRDRKQKLVAEMADSFEVVARAWFGHWRGARTERHAGYVMRRQLRSTEPERADSGRDDHPELPAPARSQ